MHQWIITPKELILANTIEGMVVGDYRRPVQICHRCGVMKILDIKSKTWIWWISSTPIVGILDGKNPGNYYNHTCSDKLPSCSELMMRSALE